MQGVPAQVRHGRRTLLPGAWRCAAPSATESRLSICRQSSYRAPLHPQDHLHGRVRSVEKFHCVSCGHRAHADAVGALNVLRAGLVRRNAQPGMARSPDSSEGGVT
ncbi:hypothetical protein FFZ77_29930 [Streptomyces katsurahamanus]|uniref:Transposase n=1 Tax=Streptomyces katsurahamanus TaxID=2577098 RepID=A0ABW9P226_9ACTN|nr:hypothetical protein [Streptomyces katsurahamanus]